LAFELGRLGVLYAALQGRINKNKIRMFLLRAPGILNDMLSEFFLTVNNP
jgi:hypothetical protein